MLANIDESSCNEISHRSTSIKSSITLNNTLDPNINEKNKKNENDKNMKSIRNNKNIVYPLRVRFNIINMQKKDALYNYGMKPVTYLSTNER